MKKRKTGFTLIELIVVLAILAIVAGIGVPTAFNSIEKTRAAACAANMESIKSVFRTEYSLAIADGHTGTQDDCEAALQTALDELKPTCPSGGTYNTAVVCINGAATLRVKCSVHDGVAPNVQYDTFQALVDEWIANGMSENRAKLMAAFYETYPDLNELPEVDMALCQRLFGSAYNKPLRWVPYPMYENGQVTGVMYYAFDTTRTGSDAIETVEDFVHTADNAPCRDARLVYCDGQLYYKGPNDNLGVGRPQNTSYNSSVTALQNALSSKGFHAIDYTLP